jgi:hypothetical protein
VSETDRILALAKPVADELYRASNERLDNIVHSLRVDMLGRPETDDALSWVLSKKFIRENVTADFAHDLLAVALYRLARNEGD